MDIKLMIVPGPIKNVEVRSGATVLDAVAEAKRQDPANDWVELAKCKEVRVNKRKFSNTRDVNRLAGYVGSISTTPLSDGDIVLIVTKVKGNEGGALECTINDQDYALETPDTIANVLRNVVGRDPEDVVSVTVNGADADLEDLVGDEDYVQVAYVDDAPEDDEPIIEVDGEIFSATPEGKIEAIKAILEL